MIVIPSVPSLRAGRAFVVDKSQHQSNAHSAASNTDNPTAGLSIVRTQCGDHRRRPRKRRRAQVTVRPARTSVAALTSPLNDSRAHFLWRLRYAALTLPALATAAGLWLLPAPLIHAVAAWWVVSDPLMPADAVLVLGGGFDRRPRAAAALYRRGLAKQVLIAQVAPPAVAAPSESLRSRAALIAAGVPAAAIAPFGKNVASTYDEARAAAGWAAASGARQLIVPTDWYHARRVSWVFRALAPPGVAITVIALPQPGAAAISADWSSLTMIAREALKYCYYRFRYHAAVREATNIRSSPAVRADRLGLVNRIGS